MVKRCKTALERQVREAVRIELKGNVLNKKGIFNRCKLTRMVIDTGMIGRIDKGMGGGLGAKSR